jgi:transcriptional regulator with XRE-family HTH domain
VSKITGKIRAIWKRLADRGYREAYVAGKVANDIAFQVFYLREHRRLTQGDLAILAGTKQPQISRIERSIGSVNVATLVKVACALNVGLSIKFVPFSRMVMEGAERRLDTDVTSFENDRLEAADAPSILVPGPVFPWGSQQMPDAISARRAFTPTGTSAVSQELKPQGAVQ